MKQKLFLIFAFVFGVLLGQESEKETYHYDAINFSGGSNFTISYDDYYDTKQIPRIGGYLKMDYVGYRNGRISVGGGLSFLLNRSINELHSGNFNYQLNNKNYGIEASANIIFWKHRILQPKTGLALKTDFKPSYTFKIYENNQLIYQNSSDKEGTYANNLYLLAGFQVKIFPRIYFETIIHIPLIRDKDVMYYLNTGIKYKMLL